MATAILLGSVVVLARLAGLGRIHAQNASGLTEAQRICENTLTEMMLGLRPLFPVESAPLLALKPDVSVAQSTQQILRPGLPQGRLVENNDSVRWLYSVRLKSVPDLPGLTILTVDVAEARQSGHRGVQYSLTRWIRRMSPDARVDDTSDGTQLIEGSIQ